MTVARTYKTLSLSLPPGVVHELTVMGQTSKCTGARVAAKIVQWEIEKRSSQHGEQGNNRRRLTALITAGTKLSMAARLVNEAVEEIEGSGLLPLESVKKIALDVVAYVRRITFAIELIPLTKEVDESDAR